VLFVLALGVILWRRTRLAHAEGDIFKMFMVGYFGFRLLCDFLKPDVRVFAGLSSIQWACVGMLLYYFRDILRWSLGLGAADDETGDLSVSGPCKMEPPHTWSTDVIQNCRSSKKIAMAPDSHCFGGVSCDGLACCGGGFALDGSQNQSLGSLARLLLSVGALSLLVFVSSLFMAFRKMLFDFIRGFWRRP